MATVNISVSQNEQVLADVADASAAADDLVLVQYFSDGKNMFNKVSVDLGGANDDVVNVPATKYQVKVTAEEALLLTGTIITYKMWKIADGFDPVLKNTGTVTVTPYEGESDPIPSFSDAQVRNVYPGQTLAAIQALISDSSSNKKYTINFYPGATVGENFVADEFTSINFIGNSSRNLDFSGADLTNGIHILEGLNVIGCDFTGVTMPTSIDDEKAVFKDVVGKWDATTTIWIDGESIGPL